jgi:hypothetical protein
LTIFTRDAFELAVGLGLNDDDLLSDGKCRGLNVPQLSLNVRIAWVHQKGDDLSLGDLPQELQPFWLEHCRHHVDASGVSAGPVETGDQTQLDWIAACVENNWNRLSRRYDGLHGPPVSARQSALSLDGRGGSAPALFEKEEPAEGCQ